MAQISIKLMLSSREHSYDILETVCSYPVETCHFKTHFCWSLKISFVSVLRKLEIQFPRFSLKQSNSLSMSLPSLGIKEIFGSTADLSGISSDEGLKMSEVWDLSNTRKLSKIFMSMYFSCLPVTCTMIITSIFITLMCLCIYYTLYGTV